MTIANQRTIFSLAQEGSIVRISTASINFEYGNIGEQRDDAKRLQDAGYDVMSAGNVLVVM